MITRKLFALLVADAEQNPVQGRTRFQKYTFLSQQKFDGVFSGDYEFFAYDYGPFSKELAEDLEELARDGYIKEEKKELDDGTTAYKYHITSKGEDILEERWNELPSGLREEVRSVRKSFDHESMEDLINYVYDQYPEYAKNSVF